MAVPRVRVSIGHLLIPEGEIVMQRGSNRSARPALTIALALLLQLSLSVFTSAGVPAAVAAPTTLTLVSEPGDAWSDAAGNSGGAVLTYGHGGCDAVDGDGFCTSGLWGKLPGAHWIWRSRLPTPDEAANGSGVVTFTKTFSVPPSAAGASGTIRVTADNSYQLYLNGVLLGQDGD